MPSSFRVVRNPRAAIIADTSSVGLQDDVATLAGRMAAASRITVLTGAGVSAASGVPTFRGPGGLWKDFRPEELATPEAFGRDPKTVWEWYDWRRQLVARCRPNRAHEVLAAWSRRYGSWGGNCLLYAQPLFRHMPWSREYFHFRKHNYRQYWRQGMRQSRNTR